MIEIIPGKAIHHATSFRGWNDPIQEAREVRVMAVAEGWAMVRRKGCAPYVAPLSEIFQPDELPQEARP